MRAFALIRLAALALVSVAALFAGLAAPAAAQGNGAQPEVVHGTECVTYPETGAPDLQYCVTRHFEYVFKGDEPLLVHEYITWHYTLINGQPVDCVQAEHIVIANGAIRHEKGRFTCP
jgi:hypothetical protein